jgi:hypothetical protein
MDNGGANQTTWGSENSYSHVLGAFQHGFLYSECFSNSVCLYPEPRTCGWVKTELQKIFANSVRIQEPGDAATSLQHSVQRPPPRHHCRQSQLHQKVMKNLTTSIGI